LDTALEIRDRDGGRRLTPAVLPSPWLFAKMDTDRDGFVTVAEARAFDAPPPVPSSPATSTSRITGSRASIRTT